MTLTKLSEQEKQFAEENHSLIYKYLHKHGYSIEEYYNVAVFGYLKAVQVYNQRTDLQDKYMFSVIAYKYMDAELGNYFRMQNSQKRKAEELDISLDAENEETESYYNKVGGKSAETDAVSWSTVEEFMKKLTDLQMQIVKGKLAGYNNSEIYLSLDLASSTYYREINRIRKILREMMGVEI